MATLLSFSFNRRLLSSLRITANTASILVIVISSTILIGWVFDIRLFRFSGNPSWPSMKFNLALSLFCSGIALYLIQVERISSKKRYFFYLCVGIVMAIGTATLAEYVFGAYLGIDELFVKDTDREVIGSPPGRMTPSAAFLLVITASALSLFEKKKYTLAQLLTIGILALSLESLVSYLYGVESFFNISYYFRMLFIASVMFFLLGIGLLVVRASKGIMTFVLSDSIGGIMARRLLPRTMVVLLAVGFLSILGNRVGLYDVEFAFSVFVLLSVLALSTIVWLNAHLLTNLEQNRMRIEDAYHRSHSQLVAIVQSSEDAIIGTTLDGVITSWNRGANRLYGYHADEVLGRSLEMLFPREKKEELRLMLRGLRQEEGRSIENVESVCIRKGGERVEVAVTNSPIKDATGKIIGASAIARDITHMKNLERRRDDFISMASHELKTPLTSMQAFVYALGKQLKDVKNEKSAYFIRKISEQIQKQTMLINDLLDVSRIQGGKLELNRETFDLTALVSEVIENMSTTSDMHVIKLLGAVSNHVFGDRERIGQVLINFLTNAIKYSPEAERIFVKLAEDDGNAIVSVQDFGIGIQRKHQSKIFERFYRIEREGQKSISGLGIGLFIASEIMKRHNGKIWVESEEGKGSTFYFSLPFV